MGLEIGAMEVEALNQISIGEKIVRQAVFSLATVLLCLALCSCPNFSIGIPTRRMPSGVGMNLWNIGWGRNWHDYYKEAVDWSTVKNPWRKEFLEDLSHFEGPIRFMDWDNANTNPIVHWEDRVHKIDDHYGLAYGAGIHEIPIGVDQNGIDISQYYTEDEYADGYTYYGAAYEWMIDLCNRTGHDMWICVPIFANDDYCRQLAELIESTLNPSLKVYLEYANETWNTSFKAIQYHMDMAEELDIEENEDVGRQSPEYQGGAYTVLRSIQIFRIFQDVFGKENTGIDRRLVRCLCSGGNGDFSAQGIRRIIYDGTEASDYTNVAFSSKYNSDGQVPDVYGLAPYADSGWDGAALNAITLFRRATATKVEYINGFLRDVINKYHFPMVAYEGGQHILLNADVFSGNPAVYEAYQEYMDTWKNMGFLLFVHYTLYSTWNSGGAWGSKESVESTMKESPKFHALVDWQKINP